MSRLSTLIKRVSRACYCATLFSHIQTPSVVFLERLQVLAPLPKAHIELLGDVYGFRSTLNVELRFRYYELALASPAGPSIKEEVAEWVVDEKFQSGGVKGRMKFCRPTFRGLKKVDEGLAKKTFESSRERFHPIARRLIQKVR